MNQYNISDLIEAYLKKSLEESEIVEIRRAEMAHLFNCVPSQINYVINTRFTVQRGYVVESKRGGGGYIRIAKIKLTDERHFLEQMHQSIGEEISEREALGVVQKLYEEEMITKNEGNLMLCGLSKAVLGSAQEEKKIRALMLQAFLERLSYEE